MAREGELAVVIHRLIGEADERIAVDRGVDLLDQVGGERLAEIDATHADAELRMQLLVSQLVHHFSTGLAVRPLPSGAM